MLKLLTGSQMREIDRETIEKLNISGLVLMENAGISVFEEIIKILKQINSPCPSVTIICGKGNNGGDGFVIARHLAQAGINITVYSIYLPDELSGSALINHNMLKNFAEIYYLKEEEFDLFEETLCKSTIIVDAIFGTGLKNEVKGELLKIIEAINECTDGFIVSVDIPSGIDSQTGKVLGGAVIADITVTFFASKIGLILYPGADFSGEIRVKDIGIPQSVLDKEEFNINLIDKDYASSVLPIRIKDSHKGVFGSVFNIAGSFGMTGAAFLSSKASLISGAGYSILAAPKSIIPAISSMSPELVYIPLEETEEGTISEKTVSTVIEKSKKSNVYLIGPGLTTNKSTIAFVSAFTKSVIKDNKAIVFDADALNCLSQSKDFIFPSNSVITPHPSELSRLLNIFVEEILNDKIGMARLAAKKFNTIVVLKTARTVIAEPDGTVFINTTGNSALATAGSGDILSGVIAGFIAQGLSVRNASILGVYLHGLAGELASYELTEYCTTASDILRYLPKAFNTLI